MALYPNPHPPMCPWYEYAEKFGSPNIKWCEETLCQWISEPANTWSNMGYILAAIYLFYRTRKSSNKAMKWFAPSMLLMGLGSYFYHASNYYISQIFDFVGMFIFVYWFAILNAFRLGWLKAKQLFPALAISSIASTIVLHYMWANHLKIQLLIVVAVVVILLTEWQASIKEQKKANHKFFLTGLIFVGSAFTFSVLDGSRAWCDPSNHIIQGHALWHILASIGLTLAYHHYEQFDFSK